MRQYIGARYMPKFLGTYDATTAYEALSVVDNGMGTSYVANQPVPAGTPLTNTTYWAVYGASSGAIIHLQDEIDDINDNIDYLEESLAGESGADETMFIADSFGYNIVTQLENNYGFAITYNGVEGGSGFNNDQYLNKLEALAPTVADPDKLKYIIAIGGTNDCETALYTTIEAKVTAFCVRARALFPKARILVGFVATLYASDRVARRLLKATVKQSYIQGVNKANVGAEFIDNLTEAVANCWYLLDSDRAHPNALGAERESNIIMQAIKKQSITIPNLITERSKTISNTSNSIAFTTTLKFDNVGKGNCIMSVDANAEIASNATFVNGTYYTLVPFDDLPLAPYQRTILGVAHIDATHFALLRLDNDGLRMYGGFYGADIAGTFSSLKFGNTVSFELPIYC